MGKREVFMEKIRKVRKDQWIVVLLAGVLLLLLSMPAKGLEEETGAPLPETERAAEDSAEKLEERLEAILGRMEGAGEVQVMITLKDGGEKIVEKDLPTTSRSTQESGSDGTARSTLEEEKSEETIYEKNGSGIETPYVTQELAPRIGGVLVLAQGGDSAVVQKNITDAVMALFGLEAHKIKVMKMNERRG